MTSPVPQAPAPLRQHWKLMASGACAALSVALLAAAILAMGMGL